MISIVRRVIMDDVEELSSVSAVIDTVAHHQQCCTTRNMLESFIEIYKANTVLWDPTNLNYNDKDARREALDKLLVVYSRMKPYATRDDVRKKINCIRSNYRKELKKMEKASLNGKAYRPVSWTFSALQFLNKVLNIREKFTGNIEDDQNVTIEMLDEDMLEECSTEEDISTGDIKTIFSRSIQEGPPIEKEKTSTNNTSKNYDRIEPHQNNYEILPEKSPPSCDDFFESLAIVWTRKLKNLDPTQRIFAEKGINDILFEAELNNLNRHSIKINIDDPLRPLQIKTRDSSDNNNYDS